MKNPFRQLSFNIQVTNYLNIGGSSDYVATLFFITIPESRVGFEAEFNSNSLCPDRFAALLAM